MSIYKLLLKDYGSLVERTFQPLLRVRPIRNAFFDMRTRLYKARARALGSREVIIESSGNKMFVKAGDTGVGRELITNGVWEKQETELFKSTVESGMVVVDIGANIGYYTLIAASIVGEEGAVYAFEPDPLDFELLLKNIELNGLTNIIPINKAVSNVNGRTKLYTDRYAPGTHSLSMQNLHDCHGSVEVETVRLDDYFSREVGNLDIDVMKIDTQGSEALIIEGARKILDKNDIKVFMEFWPFGLSSIGCDASELVMTLDGLGFDFVQVDEENSRLAPLESNALIEQCQNMQGYRDWIDLYIEKRAYLHH